MAAQKLIPVKEFCIHHNIKTDLIEELYDNELVELVIVKRTRFIREQYLPQLEKIIRLHQVLDINIGGIETVLHLLSVLQKQSDELRDLRNQLAFYSQED